MLIKNKGKFYIGKVKDFSDHRGYFFGHFINEKKFPLLRSDRLEVAWKKAPFFLRDSYQHVHKKSVEINIVISGWIKVRIKNKEYKVKKGEFYVIYPFTLSQDLEAGKNTEVVVIKVPSLPEDKFRA